MNKFQAGGEMNEKSMFQLTTIKARLYQSLTLTGDKEMLETCACTHKPAVIIETSQDSFYQLKTHNEILKQLYKILKFSTCNTNILDIIKSKKLKDCTQFKGSECGFVK